MPTTVSRVRSALRSKKIIKRIEERAVRESWKWKCPVCSHTQHTFVGEGAILLSPDLDTKALNIGGEYLPIVVVVCDKCGFVREHAQKALGLMAEEEE